MRVKSYEHNGKNYMAFISKSYFCLALMRQTCKGKTWVNVFDRGHWMLTEELV